MKRGTCIIFLITTLIGVFSCSKPQTYSPIPVITFDKVILKDTLEKIGNSYDTVKLVKLVFKLIDGDGDIGLKPDETDILYKYRDSLWNNNFFSTRYKFVHGQQIEVIDTLSPPFYRIPYVVPVGQNKTLKATISINITYPYYSTGLEFDTVRYEFFIVDRALNKSNVEVTPKIPLKTDGIIQ
jgi:hypothetical protein